MTVLLTILGIILYLGIGLTVVGFAAKQSEDVADDPIPIVLGWPVIILLLILALLAGGFLHLGNMIATWADKPRKEKPKKMRIDKDTLQKEAEREIDEYLSQQDERKSSIR
jgi:membrane-bound ClpP family serine protease